jgi:hypothetical protein
VERALKITAAIWFVILGLAVAIGAIGVFLKSGFIGLAEVFSPLNVINWGVIFLLALPGLVLFKIGNRRKRAGAATDQS